MVDDQRPAGNAVHELPLGGHGAAARLPLRAAALRRGARHRADRDQERAREPALPAPTARPGRRLPRRARFNVDRRDADRAARDLRRRQGAASRAPRAARTTCAPTRPRSGSPTCSRRRPRSSATRRWPAANGCGGTQPLNYDASDNVGVRTGRRDRGRRSRRLRAAPVRVRLARATRYADRVPCPNGPGQISVNTTVLLEGTQALVVQAQDTGGQHRRLPAGDRADRQHPARPRRCERRGRRGVAQPQRLRGRVEQSARGRPRADRGGRLQALPRRRRELQPRRAGGRRHLALRRPGAGAGRVDAVALAPRRRGQRDRGRRVRAGHARYDPEPPQLGFEPPSATDPTLVAVAGDRRGLRAGGRRDRDQPERLGHLAGACRPQKDGSRLLARIDDAALPAGGYLLRARASDQAHNEASTDRRLDGQPMALTLPLRIVSSMQAGFERVANGPADDPPARQAPRGAPPGETVLKPSARVRSGGQAQVAGRLVNRDGHRNRRRRGARALELADQPRAARRGAADRRRRPLPLHGRRQHEPQRSGSPTPDRRSSCPPRATLTMSVPALTSLRVSRRRVLNGQAVTFSGRLRTLPVPAGGKLVELQVRLSGRWQTFRTTRTDAAGRWAIRYRFKRTRGVQRFRFRARLPRRGELPVRRRGLALADRARQGPVDERAHDSGCRLRHAVDRRNSRRSARVIEASPSEGDRVRTRLRQRLTYANVMSTLAVFIALGGSSYAALTISGSEHQEPLDPREEAQAQRDHGQGGPRVAPEPRAAGEGTPTGSAASRAAELRVRCPSDTFPIADVCVERTPRAATSYGSAVLRVRFGSARRRARAGDCPRTANSGPRWPRCTLAPGGELTSDVYPSSATRGGSTCST